MRASARLTRILYPELQRPGRRGREGAGWRGGTDAADGEGHCSCGGALRDGEVSGSVRGVQVDGNSEGREGGAKF